MAKLCEAARDGDHEDVQRLLAAPGVDVNATGEIGRAALHWAAYHGDVEAVRLLLAAPGVDVNPKDCLGHAPLHVAARRCHADVVQLLLAAPGVDVNAKDYNGETPLMNGDAEVAQLLLAAPGVDVNAKDFHGRTPLHRAAACDQMEKVRQLLAGQKRKDMIFLKELSDTAPGAKLLYYNNRLADEDDEDYDKFDIMTVVAVVNSELYRPFYCQNEKCPHQGISKFMQNELAKLSPLEDEKGLTPLHCAALGGNVEVVRLLLDMGMDARSEDDRGMTPLHKAILMSSREAADSGKALSLLETCRLLWAASGPGAHAKDLYLAKDGEEDAHGISPLHYAVNLRQDEIVRLFVEQGAMVDPTLLVRWLKSDRRAELELVERLVQQLHITVLQRVLEGGYGEGGYGGNDACLGRLPEDAPLGDNRVFPLGVLKGDPRTCTQWAKNQLSDNPFVQVAGGGRSGLEWKTTAQGSGRIISSLLSVTQPTKRVTVTLNTCHADAAACSHQSVLKALGETQNMELLSTHFVEAVIRHNWNDYKVYAYIDIVVNIIVLAVALYTSALVQAGDWTAPEHAWAVVVLGCGIGKRCVEEAAQLYSSCAWADLCTYMKDSLVDLFILFTSVRGWFALLAGDLFDEDRFWLALWFATLWLRVVYSLRVVEAVGTRFLPIFRAVQSAGQFFVVVGFFFCACVHAYYMLGVRAEPSPSYAAFLQVFRLGFLGDFDLFEFEGVDPTYVNREGSNVWDPEDPSPSPAYAYTHFIFFLISMGITLLLMNLLIGVLGAAYDVEEDRASQIYLQHLASYVHTARSLPWAKRWRKIPGESEPRYLYFLARESDAADATTSMRSFLKSSMSQQDATLDAKLAALDAKLSANLDAKLGANLSQQDAKLDAKLAALDAKLAQLIEHVGC